MLEAGLLEALKDLITKSNHINYTGSFGGHPFFKKIAVWNNQLKNEKDASGYTFPTPALFIEMKQLKSIQLGMGFNMVDYEIIFHIIDTQLNYPSYLDRNIKVFQIRNIIKNTFQLYQPSRMGAMFFIKDEQDYKHDNVYNYKITFKAPLIDSFGNSYPLAGTASEVLTVGYTASINY